MVVGVAAGASRPNHNVVSKPRRPDSSMVGKSGAAGERRCNEVTAKARSFLHERWVRPPIWD